jgi:hypothetical protein
MNKRHVETENGIEGSRFYVEQRGLKAKSVGDKKGKPVREFICAKEFSEICMKKIF